MIDTVVEEVRAAREAITEKYKFNLHAIAEYARRHQARSGHKIEKAVQHTSRKTGSSVRSKWPGVGRRTTMSIE